MAADGIRYLNPEVALLFKARQLRRKDEIDLANAWPLMTGGQRTWLREAVHRAYGPDHALDRAPRLGGLTATPYPGRCNE